MRHTGWMRWRGDKTGLGEYDGAARKLLGQLEQRLTLGGIKTGAVRSTLPDGAVVEAAMLHGQPAVRVIPPPTTPPETGGRTPQAVLLQGFVVRPAGVAPDAKDEVLLVPGSANDEGERGWLSLFYDAEHTPDPAPAGPRGLYGKNPLNQPVFPDGIGVNGNLDWRNADESLVVTFFGPEDRYALHTISGNHAWGNNTPSRTGSSFANPYSTLVMINGGVVMDFADHPDYDDTDVVMGACIRDGQLVWVVSGLDSATFDWSLRFFMAPLLRHDDAKLAIGQPARLGPRFARIDHAATTLLHKQIVDRFDYFFLQRSQLFAFNQSATEGRMFTEGPGGTSPSNNDGTHELVFNFADLDNPVFTDTWIAPDLTVVGNVEGDDHASLICVLNGWETTTNDGFKGTLPCRYKTNLYKRTQAYDPPLSKIAVDYKDDVPVYLQVQKPIEAFNEVATFTDPVCVPGVNSFNTSNATSASQTQRHTASIVFPWGLEVALNRSFESTHSGESSSFYSDTTWTDFTGTFIASSSETHRTYHVEVAFILFCDLRHDTVVLGRLTSDATEDITYSASLVPTSPTILGPWLRNTTTARHLVRTWQTIVHAHGEDVVVGDPQQVQEVTTNTPQSTSTPTGSSSMDDFVSRAHDTGPGLSIIVGFGISASGEQAFRAQSSTINNAVIAAGVGVDVPITIGMPSPPPPFPLTVDYADTLGIAQLADVPFPGLHPTTLGWLYSGGGESVSLMPWAKQNVPFKVPLADPEAAPYEFTRESIGAAQVLRDAYALNIPWPNGIAQRFLSAIAGGDFAGRAGYAQDADNHPIALTSRLFYGLR